MIFYVGILFVSLLFSKFVCIGALVSAVGVTGKAKDRLAFVGVTLCEKRLLLLIL